MRKLKHFSCKSAKMFQLSKCFSVRRAPSNWGNGRISRNSWNVSDNPNQLFFFDSISYWGKGSDPAPPHIPAASLPIAAPFWVRWAKIWLTSCLGRTFALLPIFQPHWRASLQPRSLHMNNTTSWKDWFCACLIRKCWKYQEQHREWWKQVEPELWLAMLVTPRNSSI